jgi:uncharacterized protein YndB with AHSA1/START domain
MPRAQSEVFIAASPEEVWALISDLERGPEWSVVTLQCEITSASRPELGCTYRSVSKFAASKITTEHEIVEWDPPHGMVTRVIKGAESAVRWTCERQAGGTLLTMSNEFAVPAALPGLITDKLAQQVTETLAHELARIKEVVEKSQGGTHGPSTEGSDAESLSAAEDDG